jgi:hypothetical protein
VPGEPIRARELAEMIREELGLEVHPRTIERAVKKTSRGPRPSPRSARSHHPPSSPPSTRPCAAVPSVRRCHPTLALDCCFFYAVACWVGRRCYPPRIPDGSLFPPAHPRSHRRHPASNAASSTSLRQWR